MGPAALLCLLALGATPMAVGGESPAPSTFRQSRDDAWWTGPLLAASAATLPQGHFLVEPYLYDSMAYGRYDRNGTRLGTPREHDLGSLTYVLYGLVDRVSVGLLPRFGFKAPSQGQSSSGIGVGDLGLQGQYRLTQFQEGHWLPTVALVVGETLPTGKYDRLDARASDGFGAGAHTTTLSMYSQSYFWMRTGRILRARLDLSYSRADRVALEGVSVYGTPAGFRGYAWPGDSFTADSAWEYSLTRNWVLALDAVYEHDASTRIAGGYVVERGGAPQPVDLVASSGSSDSLAFAPAIEYNWNGHVGVIFGVRLVARGRNTSATITPATAVNLVY